MDVQRSTVFALRAICPQCGVVETAAAGEQLLDQLQAAQHTHFQRLKWGHMTRRPVIPQLDLHADLQLRAKQLQVAW